MNKRTFALSLHMPTLLESMRRSTLTSVAQLIVTDKFPDMFITEWDWKISMSFLDQYVSVYVECERLKVKSDNTNMEMGCDPFLALDNYVELTDAPEWTTMTDEEKQNAKELYDASL